MLSVIAETIEILKEKSPFPFQDIRIDDLVIGIFFNGWGKNIKPKFND